MTSARVDYNNILPQRNQKLQNFLWRNRSVIGRGLMFVGITFVFTAASDTDAGASIFWNIIVALLGFASAFTGLYILEPSRK